MAIKTDIESSMELTLIPLTALILLAGQQEGHLACKKGVDLLVLVT